MKPANNARTFTGQLPSSTQIPFLIIHHPRNMSDDPSSLESTSKQTVSPVKSFLSGGFGGVACVLVGHPFDLTKTRLQTAAPGSYTGAVDVVRKTIGADGIKG